MEQYPGIFAPNSPDITIFVLLEILPRMVGIFLQSCRWVEEQETPQMMKGRGYTWAVDASGTAN